MHLETILKFIAEIVETIYSFTKSPMSYSKKIKSKQKSNDAIMPRKFIDRWEEPLTKL